MKRIDKKEQIRMYCAWIWRNVKTELYNTVGGGCYSIGQQDKQGHLERTLTPTYKTPAELLAYLQGVYAARTNNWD